MEHSLWLPRSQMSLSRYPSRARPGSVWVQKREHTRGTRGRHHAGDSNHENEASAILEIVEF